PSAASAGRRRRDGAGLGFEVVAAAVADYYLARLVLLAFVYLPCGARVAVHGIVANIGRGRGGAFVRLLAVIDKFLEWEVCSDAPRRFDPDGRPLVADGLHPVADGVEQAFLDDRLHEGLDELFLHELAALVLRPADLLPLELYGLLELGLGPQELERLAQG